MPASFFHLLRDAAADADLYGFCDQDAVWLPHKVEAAVGFFARVDSSISELYCSALTPVNAELRPIEGHGPVGGVLGLSNARVLLTRFVPQAAQMHDRWAYMVVSASCLVHYDPSRACSTASAGRTG